jgi:pyruvate-formate lyase-activating enzyme
MNTPDRLSHIKLANLASYREETQAERPILSALPPAMILSTSQRCNLACRFCPYFALRYFSGRSPMQEPVMEPRLLQRAAVELFPTLMYYRSTDLGEPFISPNLDLEIELAAKHGVYLRANTNGTTLIRPILEKLDGVLDFLTCGVDSHIRGTYNFLRVGARFENTVKKLKLFSAMRQSMRPVPYFRVQAVISDLNVDYLDQFLGWCHEELGVDDVEFMGLRLEHPHQDALQVFDKSGLVNRSLDQAINLALKKAYKLRLPFLRMPTPELTAQAATKLATDLRDQQAALGFVPPGQFEAMSYVIKRQEFRGTIGGDGLIWTPGMYPGSGGAGIATQPILWPNGNVEARQGATTYLLGNFKRKPFAKIWNGPLAVKMRKEAIKGALHTGYDPGLAYTREHYDLRNTEPHLVVSKSNGGRELTIPAPVAAGPVPWLSDGVLRQALWLGKQKVATYMPDKGWEYYHRLLRWASRFPLARKLHQAIMQPHQEL